MPTVSVAVAIMVPTVQRISRVSRFEISVRTPAMSVDSRVSRLAISVRTSAICVDKRVSRFAISVPYLGNFGPQLGLTGLELVRGDVVRPARPPSGGRR